jgi:hypothetical protein
MGIRGGAEGGGATAENFGPGFQLSVYFKADDWGKFHLIFPWLYFLRVIGYP